MKIYTEEDQKNPEVPIPFHVDCSTEASDD